MSDLNVFQCGFKFLYIASDDKDISAFSGKQLGNAFAHSLRAASDQNGLYSGQLLVHRCKGAICLLGLRQGSDFYS